MNEEMNMLGRRDFLKGALSVGALTAVSQLPAWADDPTVFPQRGQYERLSIVKVHVDAGAKSPFSVLHISDTHLTDAYPNEDKWKQQLSANSTRNFGGRQEEALRDSIAWAKKNCDFLVHTGDFMDWHSQKNLDLVKKYYGEMNSFGSLGNHEYTLYHYLAKQAGAVARKPHAEIRKILAEYYPFDVMIDSRVVNGVNFVSLDDSLGRVTPEQVKRFKTEVAKGLPIVLLKHVPFYTDFIWRENSKYWVSGGAKFRSAEIPPCTGDAVIQRKDPTTRDYIAYLKTVKELKAILCGHLHVTIQDRFSPTCMEYVIGGNYLFLGEEVTFS